MRTLAFQMPERGSGGPSGPRVRVGQPSRRAKTLLITAGVLAVLAMLFVMFAGFWTDWLWYRSVGFTNVFSTQLWTKIVLFAVFGVFMALVVGFNIWLAHRLRPPLSAMSMEQQSLDRYRMGIAPYKKWLLLGVTALVGLIAGASASGQWRTWLMWVNGTPFGETDAQFGKDISFFTFDLPFYRFLLSFGFAATVLALIAAALVHYLYGGLRVTTPGARATAQATGHLSVLLGVFVALKAVAYWLDRYGLAVKSSDIRGQEDWTGLRFTDANAYLPAKTILFFIAIICAVLFFAALWRRTWQLPVIGLGLLVLSAILIGGLYPAIVERFQVQPNQQAKETPYIEKNINATRQAYGIDDAEITNYEGAGDEEGDDAAEAPKKELQAARDSVNDAASIRLLDPNVVSPAFRQTQQVRGYYTFPDNLDVDRYADADGVERDTVIGLREINVEGVPERNWINDHFKYTHGFGVVTALGTEVDYEEGGGTPVFTESDLPPKGTLPDYQPRVYYGEETTRYSIVGGPQQELDYVANDEEKLYTYEGDSGVAISGTVNRAAYALAFGEPKILYSGAIGEGSRILYNRTPKERVEAVAPWLTIDGDPYPAAVDGKIQWIVDAYTTSNGYPYSSRTTLGDTTQDALTDGQRAVLAQQDQVNYIRNSVKATVDAYTGEVKLYQWDTKDPVLKTWMKAFPGTVEPRGEISDTLLDHLRYPQDLFKVQRELLTRYHVTDPGQFYSGSERWEVPGDPTSAEDEPVPPYYLSLKMPGQDEKSFSLTTTFTPNNRQTLGAFMAVESDATAEDYGTIRLLNVPASNSVSGPQQVQSRFNSDPRIAESINLLERGDSEVEYGNLLTIPLDGGMLYVEPLYVRGADTNYPRMRKVLASYGGEIAYEDTLQDALNVVFQMEESQDPPAQEPPGEEPQEPPADQPEEDQPEEEQPDLKELEDALRDAQDALSELQDALRRAEESQADGGGGE
ncbi:UPF0182 family protein [Streptomyces sp. JJ66]|uniref:UPF0182 family membrane protein n=1 Tax=Streptomyces sp. JJ66 TaxID=2803843 RepID=UPI001C58C5B1|nr:UPF0182 family protein [Streptomyces sp. JJ66]MBW1603004.1 UPF0182 family protein [Streptomyces sp. JJ66]